MGICPSSSDRAMTGASTDTDSHFVLNLVLNLILNLSLSGACGPRWRRFLTREGEPFGGANSNPRDAVQS